MAVVVHISLPGVTARQYDGVVSTLGLDAMPAIGEILHVASQVEGGMELVEVWQTREAAQSYVDLRLRPALAAAGVHTDIELRSATLHNLYAADLNMIERIGAVSLPAHSSGAALY